MKHRMQCRAVSIVTAIMLFLGSFGVCGSIFATAAERLTQSEFLSAVERAGITVSNDTEQAELETALKGISLPNGYEVESVIDFYKIKAFEKAIEKGSTYAGAVDGEVLVPGDDGYIAAVAKLKKGNISEQVSLTLKIPAPVREYSFTSVSDESEFQISGTTVIKYNGKAQKVIIPDNITALSDNWNAPSSYCVVYGAGITRIPAQSQMRAKVVSFKGKVTELADRAFYNAIRLELIRLPDTVEIIGNEAFRNCSYLSALRLPEKLEKIGSDVFCSFSNGDTKGHILTELVIPQSVKSIGSGAFLGAKKACVITVLTDAADIAENAFYDTAYAERCADVEMRVIKGSPADSRLNSPDKKQYLNNQNLAEAAARAYRYTDLADEIVVGSAAQAKEESGQLLANICGSFGSVPEIKAKWANGSWKKSGNEYLNSLILSLEDEEFELPVKMSEIGTYDLQSAAEQAGVICSNSTTAESLLREIKKISLPDGFYVTAITDFYKLNATDSAVEKGSTYEGAVDGEILVRGIKGEVAASFTLKNAAGAAYRAVIDLAIEPSVICYSFTSCSSDDDFTYNGADWARRWEYHPKSGSAAQKLVIPDKVTSLKNDWHQAWMYNVSENVRCIVYNAGITSIPAQYNFYNLRVVSFKGDVTEICGDGTNGAFKDCYMLKNIRIPDTVKTIGTKAFYNCGALETLYLPEGLETIGAKIFYEPSESNHPGYSISDITIPSTVSSIGKYAFVDAKTPCNITVLSGNAEIADTAFYAEKGANSENITLRVLNGSTAAESNVKAAKKVFLEKDMTLAEATARASFKIEQLASTLYGSAAEAEADGASLLRRITSSYGSVESIDAKWRNDNWDQNGSELENILMLSKNGYTAFLKVTVCISREYDLQGIADTNGFKVTNSVTKYSLLDKLRELPLDEGYSIESIVDFYKLDAIEGAVERGSTYKGAVDGEILVPGEKGYLGAVVYVRDPQGRRLVSTLSFVIEPDMAEYSFATCSSDKDFSYNAAGWAQRWEYHPVSGVAAEKLVIPDKVTELKVDWNTGWMYEVKTRVRCLVYNEHITSIPPQYSFDRVEVVSIRGSVTELLGNDRDAAFKDCASLKHIRLPDSLKKIGNRAFYNCPSLTHLYLPEGLETIGASMFFESGQSYNISELTIPSTVKQIGRLSFIGAAVPSKITVLTKAAQNNSTGIHANAFYSKAYAGSSSKSVIRVIEGSGAASDSVQVYPGNRVLINDDLGYVEAAARAMQCAAKLSCEPTTVEHIENTLKTAYGFANGFSGCWENAVWTKNGSLWSNNWVISKNGARFRIPVAASLVFPDIQQIVDNAELNCSNSTDAQEFERELREILPGGYTLEATVQFYKINALNAAVDISGGKSETLVAGRAGSVKAILNILRADGTVETVTVNKVIKPETESYRFASESSEKDFEIENGVLKKYSGSAEKVVIPEGVTSISEKWLSGLSSKKRDYNATDLSIRCIVYPKTLGGVIPDQNRLQALEVVSFRSEGVTEFGENAFYKATKLKYINIPKGLKAVAAGALACSDGEIGGALEAIELPEGLETVADYAFSGKDTESGEFSGNALKEITIPMSVKSIGKYAFAYPKITENGRNRFTVTLLNSLISCDKSAFAVKAGGAQVEVRAFSSSGIYAALSEQSDTELVALDGMQLAEAAARASARAESLKAISYPVTVTPEETAASLTAAYARHGAFGYDWNGSWDTATDAKRFGKLYLTDGTYTLYAAVELNVPPVMTLSDIVEAAKRVSENVSLTNDDNAQSYKTALEENMPGRYKIEILDFDMQRAVDGARDNDGILVYGHNGSAAAIVRLRDYYGNTQTVLLESAVVPVLESYSFASVSSESDFVLSDNGKVLLEYYGTAEKLVVPNGVERIASRWMWKKPGNVRAMILPQSMQVLPENLCDGMSNLEVVSMGDRVITIGNEAFANCNSLRYIHLSDNIEALADGIFCNAYSLTDIRIPETVNKIGDKAFYACSLRSITIPGSVQQIGANAFSKMLGNADLIGTSEFPVSDSAKQRIIDHLKSKGIENTELMLTVFCDKAKVADDSFMSIYKVSPLYHIRANSGSAAYKIVSELLSGGGTAAERWKLDNTDMRIVEAAARANAKADSEIFYGDITRSSVQDIIASAFRSSNVAPDPKWTETFTVKAAGVDSDGAVSGTLMFSDINGKYTFCVPLSGILKAVRPELSEDDSDGIWEDDGFDDDFDDTDGLDEDDYSDDDLGDDEVTDDDEYTDDTDDFEDDIDDNDDIPGNGGKPTKRTNRRISERTENGFVWVWIVVGGAVVSAAAACLIIILIKRKKGRSE